MNDAAEQRQYLTTGQVAALFEVTNRTIIRWANSGALPSFMTPGGVRRYRRADVQKLMEEVQSSGY